MNALKGTFRSITNVLRLCKPASHDMNPRCTMYTDWRMARDAKRRRIVKEYARLRININSLRKNDILPKSLQEIADKEIAALPVDSCFTRIHGRCVVTSRSRGFIRPWRLSRIVFRHLSDYNYLSGIQRAMW